MLRNCRAFCDNQCSGFDINTFVYEIKDQLKLKVQVDWFTFGHLKLYSGQKFFYAFC